MSSDLFYLRINGYYLEIEESKRDDILEPFRLEGVAGGKVNKTKRGKKSSRGRKPSSRSRKPSSRRRKPNKKTKRN